MPVLETGGGSLIEGKCFEHYNSSLIERKCLDRYNKSLIKKKCLQLLQTTGGATSEVVKEDGWPDAAWPDPLGRQRQLQP